MSDKTFTGPSRWEEFEAWRTTLPKGYSVSAIGCWTNEGDEHPTLFIEYAKVEKKTEPAVCPTCGQRTHR